MTYCRISCLLIDWKRLTLTALHMSRSTSVRCDKYSDVQESSAVPIVLHHEEHLHVCPQTNIPISSPKPDSAKCLVQ